MSDLENPTGRSGEESENKKKCVRTVLFTLSFLAITMLVVTIIDLIIREGHL